MKLFFKLFLTFMIYSGAQIHCAPLDLEKSIPDFVLETTQMILPDYPHAFNPSIVIWKNKLLMSFRLRDPLTKIANQIGLVYLDQNFKPISFPRIINQAYFSGKWAQDPRLIVVDSKLYMVFNDVGEVTDKRIRRPFIAEIEENESEFFLKYSYSLLLFEQEQPQRHEKNWSPFVYQNQLLLIYSLCPHIILQPFACENTCFTVSSTQTNSTWKWGELRGGTPALLEEGDYLSFFHTCQSMASIHSNGQIRDHYFIGAYTFESQPPFAITRMSTQPIVGKNFYHGDLHQTWKPLHVVFPGGYISNRDFLWVVYGRQDHEMWVVKLDKQKFLRSLKSVQKS